MTDTHTHTPLTHTDTTHTHTHTHHSPHPAIWQKAPCLTHTPLTIPGQLAEGAMVALDAGADPALGEPALDAGALPPAGLGVEAARVADHAVQADGCTQIGSDTHRGSVPRVAAEVTQHSPCHTANNTARDTQHSQRFTQPGTHSTANVLHSQGLTAQPTFYTARDTQDSNTDSMCGTKDSQHSKRFTQPVFYTTRDSQHSQRFTQPGTHSTANVSHSQQYSQCFTQPATQPGTHNTANVSHSQQHSQCFTQPATQPGTHTTANVSHSQQHSQCFIQPATQPGTHNHSNTVGKCCTRTHTTVNITYPATQSAILTACVT